jgi:hypothetical protein
MNATGVTAMGAPIPVSSGSKMGRTELVRLLASLGLAVALFDLCFWKIDAFGFSTALFFALLAVVIMVNRTLPLSRTSRWLLLLLGGTVVASAIESGFTNTIELFVLTLALAGDTFFSDVESAWGRWMSQIVAWGRAPGRVFWLAGVLLEAAFSRGLGWAGGLIGIGLMTVPALVLALIFGLLLASGNAVFGDWTEAFFNLLWKIFDIDVERLLLWLFIGLLILPLLRPVKVSAWWWSWTQRLPRLPEIVPARAATFSSALVLVVLNGLFLVANIADLLFLWSGETLPKGVSYSGFLHGGVENLTFTVLLSAMVLTGIFQQALSIAQRRGLKLLAYAWVAQNLFLMLSVCLRLKNYIDAYGMSVDRLGVMIFLTLVAAGYALLTIKIWKEKSLSWLVGGCALAVFATFYVTQFLDLAGWSANYNVAWWERNRSEKVHGDYVARYGYRTQEFDAYYLGGLGPAAWPALFHAHEVDPNNEAINAAWKEARCGLDASVKTGYEARYWREFSLRAWMNRWALEEQ